MVEVYWQGRLGLVGQETLKLRDANMRLVDESYEKIQSRALLLLFDIWLQVRFLHNCDSFITSRSGKVVRT